jgi:hypothetical protein
LPKIDKTARLATYLALLVVLTNINISRIANRAFDSRKKGGDKRCEFLNGVRIGMQITTSVASGR